MKFFVKIFFLNNFYHFISSSLIASKVVVRTPKPNDIGLLFDLTVKNEIKDDKKELLEFKVHASRGCSLELGPGRDTLDEAGRIVGGNFGSVEAGASETVTLILPTISLYNRVGCCPFDIIVSNVQNQETILKESVHFDTKFETLDPQGTGLRKSKNYIDCKNFDLDYLNNCEPLICEERYFGKLNFYNKTTCHCDSVPECNETMLYDPFANECVDPNYTVTNEDINSIKKGDFKSFEDWLKEIEPNNPIAIPHKDTKHNKRANNESEVHRIEPSSGELRSYWLKGTMDGLMLVFATIGIYVIICFIIFLVVSFISRRQSTRGSFSITPSVSERGIRLRSRPSLLSQR